MDIVSGDELSRVYDQAGHQIYNRPVTVVASYDQASRETQLNVLAPAVQWQYNNYVPWSGEIFGLYTRTDRSDKGLIPLRALLRFGNVPVVGHAVGWDFDGIYDKAGIAVLRSNPTYLTYGRLSGPASITGTDGGATATFFRGYHVGHLRRVGDYPTGRSLQRRATRVLDEGRSGAGC